MIVRVGRGALDVFLKLRPFLGESLIDEGRAVLHFPVSPERLGARLTSIEKAPGNSWQAVDGLLHGGRCDVQTSLSSARQND